MSKKVAISAKPAPAVRESSAEAWVKQRQVAAEEPMKRFTIDVPERLHRRIKAHCALQGVKMADEIRRLLDEHFPEQG
jgi:hypothetical protein